MSKICTVCGKSPAAGRNVSHSHRVTNRVFRPNIQKVTRGHQRPREEGQGVHQVHEGRQGHPRLACTSRRTSNGRPIRAAVLCI